MFDFLKKKEDRRTIPVTQLKAYVSGEAIDIVDVKDGMFSEKIMGDGMAIRSLSETVVAPCDGEITVIAETKHAIGLQVNNGLQILIHIGLDTVSMNGKGFQVFVKTGQKVSAGQKLVSFSKADIEAAGYSDTVILVFVENEKEVQYSFRYGSVEAGKTVITDF